MKMNADNLRGVSRRRLLNILKISAFCTALLKHDAPATPPAINTSPTDSVIHIDPNAVRLILPARDERVELPGDPAFGTITYYRQIHTFPGLPPQNIRAIGNYQYKILRGLEKSRIKHVFIESLYEDSPPHDPKRNGTFINKKLHDLFDRDSAFPPTNEQARILASAGAGRIYAHLYNDVFMHKTVTPDEAEKINLNISGGLTYPIYTEKWATREIFAFLQKNPGSHAALIFGGLHQFSDDFSAKKPSPRLISVSFPRLYEEFKRAH